MCSIVQPSFKLIISFKTSEYNIDNNFARICSTVPCILPLLAVVVMASASASDLNKIVKGAWQAEKMKKEQWYVKRVMTILIKLLTAKGVIFSVLINSFCNA